MKIEEFKGNGQKLFSLMYDIIGRIKENWLQEAQTSEQDLTNKLCNIFVDKIANNREKLRDNRRFVLEKEREPGILEFNQVSVSYVQKIIEENKAINCRTDPIIKKFKVYFFPVITSLINLSHRSGTFAKDWKVSTVMPLIEKANLSKDMKNYRPVNKLCIISKYVEKAMLEQLNTYMTTLNLLPDYSLAYRKKKLLH